MCMQMSDILSGISQENNENDKLPGRKNKREQQRTAGDAASVTAPPSVSQSGAVTELQRRMILV